MANGVSDGTSIDRASIRRRPGGWPIMYQTWDKLLFLHWPVAVDQLRPLIPAGLGIDTWQGMAWVGVTPFTIHAIRPPLAPALPVLSNSHELNVRTYVHRDGVPGVWFLSLDASNVLAVWGARLGYALPYFHAAIEMDTYQKRVDFRSVRKHRGAAPAEFQATWQTEERLPDAALGTRDFFLIERYCLYSSNGRSLYRARIFHQPWPLCAATLDSINSSMLQSHALVPLEETPLVHAQAEPLRVGVWPPQRIGRSTDLALEH